MDNNTRFLWIRYWTINKSDTPKIYLSLRKNRSIIALVFLYKKHVLFTRPQNVQIPVATGYPRFRTWFAALASSQIISDKSLANPLVNMSLSSILQSVDRRLGEEANSQQLREDIVQLKRRREVLTTSQTGLKDAILRGVNTRNRRSGTGGQKQ